MASDWEDFAFGEAFAINPGAPLANGDDYPFVDMASVSPASRCVRATETRVFTGGGSRFVDRDTLMARITPCLENGKIAQYCGEAGQAAHGSTEFIVIRGRKRVSDTDFAYYLTRSDGVSGYAISQMTGTSGRQRVPTDALSSLEISLPPLPEQRAIAHILGTLDDKIELNRRTSETLEAMARALFKSWFVDFDPVRAKVDGRWQCGQSLPGLPARFYDLFPDRLVDSELGDIPEGWEIGAIENLCESISSGGTPARMNAAFWTDGTIPWFKTGELLDGPLLDPEEHITEMALANSSCKLWPEGTILFALYASPTVGRLGVLTSPGTSNQAAAGLMAKASYGIPFLRRVLLDARQKLQSIAVGAAQQNINQAVLKSHQIVIPPMALATDYSRRISASDAKQVALAREMRNLAYLRDALLPKLISGELRVPEAMRMAEAAS